MLHIRQILYATDFSRQSRRAFHAAVALARATRSRLLIVHVVSPLILAVPPQTREEVDRSERARAERRLARLAAEARTAGVRALPRQLEGVRVDEPIVRAARAAHVDLIVMAAEGPWHVGRALLGSVPARVLAAAPCSVLAIRGRVIR
jgi:nucleotide-binding universal stress UspA family protein